jgi:hypothetical protein
MAKGRSKRAATARTAARKTTVRTSHRDLEVVDMRKIIKPKKVRGGRQGRRLGALAPWHLDFKLGLPAGVLASLHDRLDINIFPRFSVDGRRGRGWGLAGRGRVFVTFCSETCSHLMFIIIDILR